MQTEHTFRKAEQQIVEKRNRLEEYEARMSNRGDANVQRYYIGILEQTRSRMHEEHSNAVRRWQKHDLDRDIEL